LAEAVITMWAKATVLWLALASLSQAPGRPAWEVVRSADGDFAFSMPVKPVPGPPGAAGADEVVAYSCEVRGCSYEIRRTRRDRRVAAAEAIAELATMRKGYLVPGARLVKETKIVVDGVPGDDLTYSVDSPPAGGIVTRRIRYFLKGRHRYELTVTAPPGQPLPDDATRFLSSLTFEALVRAQYAAGPRRPTVAAPSVRAAPRAGRDARREPTGPGTKIELVDATPEEALKTFLLALAAQDGAILRAITLPDEEFDWLLKGRPAPPELLATMRSQLDRTPFRRLAAGDRVTMPGNRSGVIQPVDVREGRVVLLPRGAPFPTRLERVDGHWKVLARTFIAARKAAEAQRDQSRKDARGDHSGPSR
jgi:hypothetical protein